MVLLGLPVTFGIAFSRTLRNDRAGLEFLSTPTSSSATPAPMMSRGASSRVINRVVPMFSLRIGQADVDALASTGPARQVVEQLRADGTGAGVLTPIEVLVPQAGAGAHSGNPAD